MYSLQIPSRSLPWACALLGLISATGCHQLSKTVRNEQPLEEQAAPLPPDLSHESPFLQPVPQHLPLMPPPAPPADASVRTRLNPHAADDLGWDGPEVAEIDSEASEFFPESGDSTARQFIMERGHASEARYAEEGQLAALREAARPPRMPVIVPARPALQRISSDELKLIPVPK